VSVYARAQYEFRDANRDCLTFQDAGLPSSSSHASCTFGLNHLVDVCRNVSGKICKLTVLSGPTKQWRRESAACVPSSCTPLELHRIALEDDMIYRWCPTMQFMQDSFLHQCRLQFNCAANFDMRETSSADVRGKGNGDGEGKGKGDGKANGKGKGKGDSKARDKGRGGKKSKAKGKVEGRGKGKGAPLTSKELEAPFSSHMGTANSWTTATTGALLAAAATKTDMSSDLEHPSLSVLLVLLCAALIGLAVMVAGACWLTRGTSSARDLRLEEEMQGFGGVSFSDGGLADLDLGSNYLELAQ